MQNEIEYLFKYCNKLIKADGTPANFGYIFRYDAGIRNPLLKKLVDRALDGHIYRTHVLNDAANWKRFQSKFNQFPPTFISAGSQKNLWKEPSRIRAAILTGGGVASGLNRVVHSIVRRHYDVYKLDESEGGIIYGIRDGFHGLSERSEVRVIKLDQEKTRRWLDCGGTMLGSLRSDPRPGIEKEWLSVLKRLNVDIIYIIGGNGSQTAAYKLYSKIINSLDSNEIVVAGIPKTMDNDIFWTDRSFGFQSTVDEAARIIKALKEDAFSTRRLCIIQLFGRDSGFVAASASLASGCVDVVLIPEECQSPRFNADIFCDYLKNIISKRMQRREDYGIIVAAEGAGPFNNDREKNLKWLEEKIIRQRISKVDLPRGGVFINEPRHLIRAIPPNPNDQIFCQRLADLTVDNALAGFTGFMVTRWLSNFVLVPLKHVAGRTKRIDIDGLLWKQVKDSTSQPSFSIRKKLKYK